MAFGGYCFAVLFCALKDPYLPSWQVNLVAVVALVAAGEVVEEEEAEVLLEVRFQAGEAAEVRSFIQNWE